MSVRIARTATQAAIASFLALASTPLLAFDTAKVLPRGVRGVTIRTVQTEISKKTDGNGTAQPLAEPLQQGLTFAKITQGEAALKANKLRAFLLTNGFSEDEAVGEFTADLNAHVAVVAPITSYGLTDKLTLAVAVPIYRAETALAVGFQANPRAQAFINALADPKNNLDADAREAVDKLNHAVAELNQKLVDHGYSELDNWRGQGIGDVTLAGKYLFYNRPHLLMATTNGVVAPTGRTDDPDVLTDMPFGDGQWDVFTQVNLDQPVPGAEALVFNQNAKYTAQLPGRKTMRATTAAEKIDVDKTNVAFKLGDKLDAGIAVQWQPAFGLVSGIGYTYFRKYGDVYRHIASATKMELEHATDQVAHNGEAVLGYSTIPAFQRHAFPAPLELKLTYLKQFASRNMPVSDLAQLDLSLFF